MQKFRKIKMKKTPSGLWDNGFYYISDEIITFPKNVFENAIIENKECKGIDEDCIKITILNKSWIVLDNEERKKYYINKEVE